MLFTMRRIAVGCSHDARTPYRMMASAVAHAASLQQSIFSCDVRQVSVRSGRSALIAMHVSLACLASLTPWLPYYLAFSLSSNIFDAEDAMRFLRQHEGD